MKSRRLSNHEHAIHYSFTNLIWVYEIGFCLFWADGQYFIASGSVTFAIVVIT